MPSFCTPPRGAAHYALRGRSSGWAAAQNILGRRGAFEQECGRIARSASMAPDRCVRDRLRLGCDGLSVVRKGVDSLRTGLRGPLNT
jgi:hypothetical protein